MTPAPYLTLVLLLLACLSSAVRAQERPGRTYERKFQLSLFPGIGTNGIASGFYYNKYSINLFGGLSAGNRIFEIGLITNSNIDGATGIQLAGLANIIGTNAFLNLSVSDERHVIIDGYESNSKGIQAAGFLNYVRTDAEGIQLAGALNVVSEDFSGVQVAGVGNSAGSYAIGFQLAGLYNIAHEFMAGVQVTSLFNYTDGEMSGSQWALINKAKMIKGKNSTPHTNSRGMQFGLINFSKSMHGTQIGLINFGGEMRGKQFGLINFFNRDKSKELSDAGMPVGLLNLGSRGSVVRIYFNELFPTNIEYTTGNCQNCTWTPAGPIGMPYTGRNKIFNQNALILGFDPWRDTWGFGWGFQKILRNKASMLPTDKRNEKQMISYGLRFLHLNRAMRFDKVFNLLNRLHFEYGRRRGSKYVFLSFSLNYFLRRPEIAEDEYPIQSFKIASTGTEELSGDFWAGYGVGVQF